MPASAEPYWPRFKRALNTDGLSPQVRQCLRDAKAILGHLRSIESLDTANQHVQQGNVAESGLLHPGTAAAAEDEMEMCIICLDDVPEISFPCGCRVACKHCAEQWSARSRECPWCRAPLPVHTGQLLKQSFAAMPSVT